MIGPSEDFQEIALNPIIEERIESDNFEPNIIGPQNVTPFTFKNTIKEGVIEEIKVENVFSLKKIKESDE